MSDIENPQAFPLVDGLVVQPGMDLRDWFAGRVMQSAFVNATGLLDHTEEERSAAFTMVAQLAYEAADAMLAARKGAAS